MKQKSFTDIEQSKKLAEILPLESAEHHYVRKVCDFRGNSVDGKWSEPKYGNPESSYANYLVQNFTSYEIIPCWSLAALLDVINQVREIKHQRVTILVGRYANEHWYVEILRVQDERSVFLEHSKELVNACYDMIIKLNGLNLL